LEVSFPDTKLCSYAGSRKQAVFPPEYQNAPTVVLATPASGDVGYLGLAEKGLKGETAQIGQI
jgi:hypothetical protein